MKRYLLLVAGLSLPVSAFATGKPCEELKAKIAQKLDAKGVANYTLEIVPKEQETTAKVVGTCEGGTKKIVYDRTSGGEKKAEKPAKQ